MVSESQESSSSWVGSDSVHFSGVIGAVHEVSADLCALKTVA